MQLAGHHNFQPQKKIPVLQHSQEDVQSAKES